MLLFFVLLFLEKNMTSVQNADSAFLRGVVGMFGLSWLFPAPQPIGQATLARHKASLQQLSTEASQQLEKMKNEEGYRSLGTR